MDVLSSGEAHPYTSGWVKKGARCRGHSHRGRNLEGCTAIVILRGRMGGERPLVVTMGGGYGEPLTCSVEAHADLFLQAAQD